MEKMDKKLIKKKDLDYSNNFFRPDGTSLFPGELKSMNGLFPHCLHFCPIII